MIQAVLRAEIRDAALTRDARPAEKHGAVRLFQQFFQPLFHSSFRLSCRGRAAGRPLLRQGHTRRTPEARQRMLLVHLYAVHAVPPHHAAAGKPQVFAPQHFS